jgi:hypothetical protein
VAPAAGAVLVGPGEEEAQAHVDWDGPEVAALLAGSGDALLAAAGPFEAALCYSRSEELARGLSALADRVIVHDPAPLSGEHAASWLARALHALSLAGVGPGALVATPDELAAAGPLRDRLPAGFLAIHPGSGSPRKNWPVARFSELVARVSPGRRSLLVAGPADPPVDLPGAVVARDLPLRVLGGLLARAGAYVGNDSGVSHLAAAFGARTTALFGPTNPDVWAPVGTHVRIVRAHDRRMDSIEVEEVERALATSGGPALPSR